MIETHEKWLPKPPSLEELKELHDAANRAYRKIIEREASTHFWGPLMVSSEMLAADPANWYMTAVGDPDPEDTVDITPEPPKPVVNPFYPKSRNPE